MKKLTTLLAVLLCLSAFQLYGKSTLPLEIPTEESIELIDAQRSPMPRGAVKGWFQIRWGGDGISSISDLEIIVSLALQLWHDELGDIAYVSGGIYQMMGKNSAIIYLVGAADTIDEAHAAVLTVVLLICDGLPQGAYDEIPRPF